MPFHPYCLQESSTCVRWAVCFSRVFFLLWHFVWRNRALLWIWVMHDTKEVSTMKAGISNSWGFDMPHLLQVSSLIETTRNFVYIVASSGRFRWREPQQPGKVTGIQQADNEPNMCWQAGDGSAPVTPFPTHNEHPQRRASPPSSEDCLFLKYVLHRR